jgi:hypothetical protein
MRLLLASFSLLCTSAAFAAGLWGPAREVQRQPTWPSPSQRELPPAGFVPQEDRVEDLDLSPGEAARRAQQMNGGGRVLAVEQAQGGWRVKLIKNGDVRIVFVPD